MPKSKSPEELFKEREQRWNDALALKEPDRVPLAPFCHFYPTLKKGMSFKEAMFDHAKTAAAYKEIVLEYNWDMAPTMQALFSGPVIKALKARIFKVPGIDLPDNVPFQFNEAERMKAEEYEEFFANPSDFVIRKWLPRSFGAFEAYQTLPEISSFIGYGAVIIIPMLTAPPPFAQFMEDLKAANQAVMSWMGVSAGYEAEMRNMGYPTQFDVITMSPFDVASEFLRGLRGTMLDMYRHPEELKHLIDLLTPYQIQGMAAQAQMFGNPRVFIPLHRGAGGFMSNEQFEEFYWPSLKKIILDLIKEGLQPVPFYEGDYNPRLEYLKELPKGKTVAWLDRTDIFKAKEEIGDRICLKGNIPASLFVAGTPAQMEEYCKKLIDIVGEGGGFMIDGAVSGIPDNAKPENVKAMADAVFKYGVYNK
ncbi:MAG: uroporphyrinogen decarboxylase family protein [Candidatus Lokiarchaeia archaeon]